MKSWRSCTIAHSPANQPQRSTLTTQYIIRESTLPLPQSVNRTPVISGAPCLTGFYRIFCAPLAGARSPRQAQRSPSSEPRPLALGGPWTSSRAGPASSAACDRRSRTPRQGDAGVLGRCQQMSSRVADPAGTRAGVMEGSVRQKCAKCHQGTQKCVKHCSMHSSRPRRLTLLRQGYVLQPRERLRVPADERALLVVSREENAVKHPQCL